MKKEEDFRHFESKILGTPKKKRKEESKILFQTFSQLAPIIYQVITVSFNTEWEKKEFFLHYFATNIKHVK